MVQETAQLAESTGVLGSLGLNGKLFAAQLVNFSVVMFVMWRWVYRPLLLYMDERTAMIEKGLKDAEAAAVARTSAESERDSLVTEARLQCKKIIEEAEVSAMVRRDELMVKTKKEVEKVVLQGKNQLKADQEAMLRAVKAEVADLVVLTTTKVLAEVMDDKKDQAVVKAAALKFSK